MVSIIIFWRYNHIIFSLFLIILVTFSRFWLYLTLMKRWLSIVHDKMYINFYKACFITRHHFLNAYGLCNFIATEMKSASDIETTLTYPSLILSFQNVLFSKVKIPTNEIKRGRYKKLFFCIMYGCVISRWRQACIKWHTTEQVYRISKGNEHRRATK